MFAQGKMCKKVLKTCFLPLHQVSCFTLIYIYIYIYNVFSHTFHVPLELHPFMLGTYCLRAT